MIRLASKFWRILPYWIRLRAIRVTQPKFTVSVVAIIINNKGEVLILDHFIRPGASWGLPGGFIESGEIPDDAIKREIMEETGLDLTELNLLRIRTLEKHIEMLYSARSSGSVTLHGSEIRDFGWFAKEYLPKGLSVVQRRIINDVLSDDFT